MKPTPKSIETATWEANKEALRARGSLLIWLNREISWRGQASGTRDGNPIFRTRTLVFSVLLQVC